MDFGSKGTLAPFRAFASGIFANCEEFHSNRSIRLLALKILSPQALKSNIRSWLQLKITDWAGVFYIGFRTMEEKRLKMSSQELSENYHKL